MNPSKNRKLQNSNLQITPQLLYLIQNMACSKMKNMKHFILKCIMFIGKAL